MNKKNLLMITITGVLLGLAVILNTFVSIVIPIGGAPILRVRISAPLIKFPAVMFGPFFGAVAGGLCDILSFVVNPGGAYLWPLTVVEIVKGAAIGFIWIGLKNVRTKAFKYIYLGFFVVMTVLGAVNLILRNTAPTNAYIVFLRQIGSRQEFAFIGILATGLVGLVSFAPAYFLSKRTKRPDYLDKYLKVFLAVGVPGLVGNTINTKILQYFHLLSDKVFVLLWLPRFIEELMVVSLTTYILIIMFDVYSMYVEKGRKT